MVNFLGSNDSRTASPTNVTSVSRMTSVPKALVTIQGAVRSVATVRLFQERHGELTEIGSGNALYRDDRDPLEGYSGPVRQLCSIDIRNPANQPRE